MKIIICFFVCFFVLAQGASFTINWNSEKQRIDGFGACSAWMSTMSQDVANMYFSATSGAGLSLLRTRIAPSAPNATTELNIAKLAVALGATVWSAPWSPPAKWKDNNNLNNGGHLMPSHYTDYANYLADFVVNMKNQGVPIYAISTQNEPDMNVNYESCIFDAPRMHDWVKTLSQVFKQRNIPSKIMIGEQSGWSFTISQQALSDSAVASGIDIVAAHFYSGSPNGPAPYNKTIWETEHFFQGNNFDTTMRTGLQLGEEIHRFIAVVNANAYLYWHLAPSAGNSNAGLTGPNYEKTKRLFVMGQFSRFVRPGWVRIDASPASSGSVFITAYHDASKGNFAIVVINSGSASTSISLALNGAGFANVKTLTPYITDATHDIGQLAAINFNSGGPVNVTVPSQSVTTYLGSV